MIDSIIYKQLGVRICLQCYDDAGIYVSVYLDMDDTKALMREVRKCERCGLLSVGEKVPDLLKKFFDDNPESPPDHEVIAA